MFYDRLFREFGAVPLLGRLFIELGAVPLLERLFIDMLTPIFEEV